MDPFFKDHTGIINVFRRFLLVYGGGGRFLHYGGSIGRNALYDLGTLSGYEK